MIVEEKKKIRSFKDLSAWQEGHVLVLMIYELTKTFPKEEAFGLTSQMRRAAVSITSNIAEGFSRQSFKEKIQFYFLAQGSVTELENQIEIAKDVRYIPSEGYHKTLDQLIRVQKILNGLIKKSRTFLHS